MWALWLVLALLLSGAGEGKTQDASPAETHRQLAIQINDLAANVHSEADARQLVDAIAQVFAKNLPPFWATGSVRERVARAEYQAVADPSKLIPEQRIVDVWSRYVREVGAPEEALVTVAEIHSLRDDWTIAKTWWAHGNQNIWAMPNIYALGPEGRVASGSRAIEALRVLYQLENRFVDLKAARERLRRKIVASDSTHASQETTRAGQKAYILMAISVAPNLVSPAEQTYIRQHGNQRFRQLLQGLFDELFPPGT